jgi:hypothetical protein
MINIYYIIRLIFRSNLRNLQNEIKYQLYYSNII